MTGLLILALIVASLVACRLAFATLEYIEHHFGHAAAAWCVVGMLLVGLVAVTV